jgi:hypothetical protein
MWLPPRPVLRGHYPRTNNGEGLPSTTRWTRASAVGRAPVYQAAHPSSFRHTALMEFPWGDVASSRECVVL